MLGAVVKCYNAYLRANAPKVDWFIFEAYSQEAVLATEQGKSQKAFAVLYRHLHGAIDYLSTERPVCPTTALESLGLRLTTSLCKISGLGAISKTAEQPLLSRTHRAAYQLVNIFGNLSPSGLSHDSAALNSVLDMLSNSYWQDIWSGIYNWFSLDIFRSYTDIYSDHAELEKYPAFGWELGHSHGERISDISLLCSYLLTYRLVKLSPDDFLVGQAMFLFALVQARAGQHDSSAMLLQQLVIHRLRYCPTLEWSIEAAKRELYRVAKLRPG